jgi:3-oxoacyl-[acyl-carrier protein] reductase
MRFEDKVVIVTGSSRGIGRGIALEFGLEGASVIVNYRSNADAADQVVEKIKAGGSRAIAVQADVSKFEQAQDLIKVAIEEFGDLQILVNNAGTTRDGLIMTMKEPDWDHVVNTNLKSTFNCSRAAVRHMIRKRYGRIINITSVIGNAGQTNYSASKAGQIGFTKALAREVASRNITVNAVAPGFISTELTESLPEELKTGLKDLIPLGRVGTPEEVAKAVLYLASEEAGYVTGHVLSIDGGMAMF